MLSYEYNGFHPYGAGDMFCIDQYVENDFSGNVTEQLLSEGYQLKKAIDPVFKKLKNAYELFAPDGRSIAVYIKETPQGRYNKKTAVYVSLKLNKGTDADLIDALEKAHSKQGLIKEALRSYLKK